MSWINLNKSYKNILALMLGLLIAVIIAEILLRIHNPIPATVKGDSIVLRALRIRDFSGFILLVSGLCIF